MTKSDELFKSLFNLSPWQQEVIELMKSKKRYMINMPKRFNIPKRYGWNTIYNHLKEMEDKEKSNDSNK